MKVGDVVAWNPTRGAQAVKKVKFVGVVTGIEPARSWSTNIPHVYVIWNELTMPTLNDPKDISVIWISK